MEAYSSNLGLLTDSLISSHNALISHLKFSRVPGLLFKYILYIYIVYIYKKNVRPWFPQYTYVACGTQIQLPHFNVKLFPPLTSVSSPQPLPVYDPPSSRGALSSNSPPPQYQHVIASGKVIEILAIIILSVFMIASNLGDVGHCVLVLRDALVH